MLPLGCVKPRQEKRSARPVSMEEREAKKSRREPERCVVDVNGRTRRKTRVSAMEDRREKQSITQGPGHTQLVFYSQSTGVGSIFRANADGQAFDLVHQHEGWSKNWDIMVSGRFGGTSGQDDLLFYTRTGGGSFFQINTDGSVHLIKTNTGWAKTWSHIVRLKPSSIKGLTPTSQDRLLFYDRTNCVGYFFKVDRGNVTAIGEPQRGWAQWDNVVALDIGLLFYRYPGQCCLYALDSQCKPQFLKKYDFGSFDWTCIASGPFSTQTQGFRDPSFPPPPTADVLLYERKSGIAFMYTFNDKGEIIRPVFEQQSWAKGWNYILPGTYQPGHEDPTKSADLFCFDCTISKGASFGDNGQTVLARMLVDNKVWTHIVAVTNYNPPKEQNTVRFTSSTKSTARKMEVIDVDADPTRGEDNFRASERIHLHETLYLMDNENTALKADIQALKKEKDELWQNLQRMQGNKLEGLTLKQLEALEEELFGAMKRVTAKKAEAVVQEKEAEKKLCIICMEKPRDIVFVDCSHLCCCQACSDKVTNCPLCRKQVTSKLKVFDVNS